MASGAEVIGAAIYHALGYNVVQGYIVDVDPARIVIAPNGHDRGHARGAAQMTREDVDRSARARRAAAERQVPRDAQPVRRRQAARLLQATTARGPTIPTTSTRTSTAASCAANRVFAAWLNHDDSRGINSLDMLETAERAPVHPALHVRLRFDHGQRQHGRAGAARGQRIHPRMGARVEDAGDASACTCGRGSRSTTGRAKSVGRFEGDFFDPVKWRPEYPNPRSTTCGRTMRSGPRGWCARFQRRGDPRHRRERPVQRAWCGRTPRHHLIKRRDKVLRAWLTGVNPIVEPRLDGRWRPHIRKRCGGRSRRRRTDGLRVDMVALRQRDRRKCW